MAGGGIQGDGGPVEVGDARAWSMSKEGLPFRGCLNSQLISKVTCKGGSGINGKAYMVSRVGDKVEAAT